MSDYSAVNPPTEKNQSQAFAAALQRAKEVRNRSKFLYLACAHHPYSRRGCSRQN